MRIKVNEKYIEVQETTLFELRDKEKPDADVLILNGHVIKEDKKLLDGDTVTFIKRGEIPTKKELESLLVARHTPGVHEKINGATIGIAGLGGLGSNIATSLARMGVGKLVLVDFDVVEPSNINRQAYFLEHIGWKKSDATADIISKINPFVEVESIERYLSKENIEDTFKECDIVVEAFDNPTCKAEITNVILQKTDKPIVCASGMAGYFSSNTVVTRKVGTRMYLIGDLESEAKVGQGLMAPRVQVAANHQANMVIRILLGETQV